jgi:hypothetical protein
MAFIIKNKGTNYLYAIATTQANADSYSSAFYDVVSVSDSDFNKLNLDTGCLNSSGNVVDKTVASYSQEQYELKINEYKSLANDFVSNNPNHPLVSSLNSFKTYLDSLDVSGLSYPMSQTLEQYIDSQGQTVVGALQIK